ncbi:MAG: hypothetical protein KBA46_03230 [Candidatus Omnitrophica bacterium]|nr:hypothetical protein [Candidatus Omnitrophota bacterium]
MSVRQTERGFGLLEIVLTAAILLVVYFILMKVYFKKTIMREESQRVTIDAGIDTSNYQSILDSSRDKIHAIQRQHSSQLEDMP